ncbi:MAG: hypothetical protein INR64_02600 [Caulobacteraceae bacterium]|nr:hypothetical protein [Caulobacter sp.]
MSLEDDLRRLADKPPGAALDGVEAGVWRRAAVQARAAERRGRAQAMALAAAAAVALAGTAGLQAAARLQPQRSSELAVLSTPVGGLGGLAAAVAQ